MSSCGGNCGCNGSDCKCGSGCGCKNYPDIEFSEQSTTTHTLISGLAPVKGYYDDSEMNFGSENGCKCGSSCSCDPCTCK